MKRLADQFPRGGGYHIGSTTTDDREFAWCAFWHSGQLSAYRNAELKMAAAALAVASVGTCWPGIERCTQTAAPPTRAAPRSSRSTAQRWMRIPATITSKAASAIAPRTPARWGQCKFLPGTRYATDGDDDGVRDPQNLFDSTLPQPATRVAVGYSTCARRGRAALLRYKYDAHAQNVLAGPPATPPVCSRLTWALDHRSATTTLGETCAPENWRFGPACRSMSTA